MKFHALLFAAMLCCAGSLHLPAAPSATAEDGGSDRSWGEISDPDGFTNVRTEASKESAVVATVKTGEVFELVYDYATPKTWKKVKLASGKTGYIHASRVRRHYTMQNLADTTPGDEVNEWSRNHHLPAYYPLARKAAKGDRAAMQRFFGTKMDGAGEETNCEVAWVVAHLLGDEPLARFLDGQSKAYLAVVREKLLMNGDGEEIMWEFPKAAKVLSIHKGDQG